MRKVTGLLALVGLIAAVALLGACKQATDSGAAVSSSTLEGITVYGSVGGRIVGPDGSPLSGITVSTTTGGVSRDIVSVGTDGNGHFELTKLISGVHTIFLGNGVSSTALSITVTVPDLAALRNDSQLATVLDTAGNPLTNPSLITPNGGPYFVNISLTGGSTDVFTLYPCNATLTGIAKIKTIGTDSDDLAAFPATDYTIVADFAAWNNSMPLLRTGTVAAATGVFTIANVPAVGLISDPAYTITLRLDHDTIIDGTTSDITSAVSPTGIADGEIQAGKSRAIGTHYFVAAIAPTVVAFSPAVASTTTKFDPGTALARTPLVFTFSKSMDTAKGSLAVTDGDIAGTDNNSYLYSGAWTAGNTVYTVTPNDMFEYGKTITATFTGFESADGVPFVDGPFTFIVRDALKLVSANSWVAYGTTPLNSVLFPVANDIVLTFNVPLSSFDPFATFLQDAAGQNIPAAISIDTTTKTTLTFNPTNSLVNNVAYKVMYKVTGALFALDDILTDSTGTVCGFTTAPAAQLATPTIAQDVPTKYIADAAKQYWQRGKYNNAETAIKVQFGFVTGADNYLWEFQYAGDPGWITGGNINTSAMTLSSDSLYYIASLALPGTNVVTPTKAITIRARARDTAAPISGAPDSAWVTSAFTIADTQAPSALAATADNLDGVAGPGAANNGPGTSDGFTVTINANANLDQYYTVTFGLAGTEPMATILPTQVIAQGTPAALTVAQVSMTKNAAGENTSCTVLFKAAKGATDPIGVYSIAVKDAAGNAYDNLNPAPTAGTDNVILITIN